ncbi:hypothetical protein M2161_009281 [Streptomyces sp. SAI-133]|uniref:hypothetical protein n=1 Tax=unclassified Streptomyces TaxID=2593676 RepID=UPI0024731708|nr:hypothetical protein [Streptomyces sp. SAI-133]MDH6590090.1 hypothetical protein [Streptomyces sp. SAI-133]
MDQGWAAVIAGGVGLVGAVVGALVGGLAAVRGARIGAEMNAAAVREQVRDQAALELQHWVRQERQKACLQVMDMYAVFNSESVRRREEMEAGTVLDEASLQSYADHSINLIGACSHLALLGPDSVQIAGGTLRRMAERFVSTLRFVNEELGEQQTEQRADGLRPDWLEMLAEDGQEMKLAYLEFMRVSQAALLPG